MARNDSPKEGVDFEWVKGPGGAKTRRFFSMAEKTKRKESGGSPVKSGSGDTKAKRRPAKRSPEPQINPRPRSRPSVALSPAPASSGGGRSNAGPGGPSTDKERAEATVSKTKTRPFGMSRETMSQRRAYDRLNEEVPTTLLQSPSRAESYGDKRRKARHGYNKGGVVKANCGASIPSKRG